MFSPLIAVFVGVVAFASAQPCNPLETLCPDVIPGFASTSYSVDFTQQTALPTADWILADSAVVTYSSMGANFSFVKRYDAPYIWTRSYMLFGRVDVEVQAAPGTGLITGAVLMSDDMDEIDWEWSGNNFGQSRDLVQTNYFGKGVAGDYDRGAQLPVDSPTTKFHTYSFDWTKDYVKFLVDGKEIRTLTNSGETSGEHQFPQTPSRLHLGIWNAGDPDSSAGVVAWAGGYLNMAAGPYSAYIRSVKITTPNPCSSWQYPNNFSGNWQDVQCTNQTVPVPSSTTTSATPRSTALAYVVQAGDNGWSIAQTLGCTFDELSQANPGLDWDTLLVGQVLSVPALSVVGMSPASLGTNSSGILTTTSNLMTATTVIPSTGSTTTTSVTTTTTMTSIATTHTVTSTRKAMPTATCPTVSACTQATVTVTVTAPCSTSSANMVGAATVSQSSSTSTTPVTTKAPAAAATTTSIISSANVMKSSSSSTGIVSTSTSMFSSTLPADQSGASDSTSEQNTSSTTQNVSSVSVTTQGPQSSTTSSFTVTSTSIIPGNVITSMSTITVWAPCTVCQTYTSGGSVLTSCSQSMNSTLSTVPVTTVLPASTSSAISTTTTSTSTIIALKTSAIPSTTATTATSTTTIVSNTVIIPVKSTILTTTVITTTAPTSAPPKTSSTSVTTTTTLPPSVTTITMPCSRCSGGTTVIVSTDVKPTQTTMTTTLPSTITTTSLPPLISTAPLASTSRLTIAGISTTTSTSIITATTITTTTITIFSTTPVTSMTLSTTVPLSNSTSFPGYFNSTSSSTVSSTSFGFNSTTTGILSRSGLCITCTTNFNSSATTTVLMSPTTPVSSTTTPAISTTSSSTILTTSNVVGSTTTPLITTTPATTSKTTTTVPPATTTTTTTTTTTAITTTTVPPPRTKVTTTATTTTTTTVPPICTRDSCLNNMLDESHIQDAHDYADSFCKDSTKPTPTWLTACADRTRATSAFECITASATPVPTASKDGRACYNFQGQSIYALPTGVNKNLGPTGGKWKRDEGDMHGQKVSDFFGRLGKAWA